MVRQVKSDDQTHALISAKIMQMEQPPHAAPVDEVTQRARRHATLAVPYALAGMLSDMYCQICIVLA